MNIGVLYFEKASSVRHFRAILRKLLMAVTSANLLAAQTLPSEVSEQFYKTYGFQHLNHLRIHILRVWRVQSKPALPLCLWAPPRAPNFDTINHPALLAAAVRGWRTMATASLPKELWGWIKGPKALGLATLKLALLRIPRIEPERGTVDRLAIFLQENAAGAWGTVATQ